VGSTAVFVDATGRRARLVMAGCWALACVFGGYVLLVVIALVVPAGTLSLSVPGLGPVLPKTEAPPLTTVPGGRGVPVSVLAKLKTPAPRAVGPARHRAFGTPTPSSAPVITAPVTSRPSSAPTSVPTPLKGNGKPLTHPTPHSSKSPPTHP
jgi:hypothetical protein